MRTGPELIKASAPYAIEDRAKTWRLFAIAVAVYGAFEAVAIFAPWWPLRVLGGVMAALSTVRLFIFYHDYLHGALWRKSFAGKLVMWPVGLLTLNPPAVWRETHDYHHKNNAKILGAAIGSYPILTVEMYRTLSPNMRRGYLAVRHPLNMLLGHLTVFALGMCLRPFLRDPRTHWGGPLALLLHAAAFVAIGFGLGWGHALTGVLLPGWLTSTAGAYLFYAQHNFPDCELRGRKNWDYTAAALKSSSMMDMSPLMHWFTGNIGFHHVHHLNHNVPFYRLPEAMAAIPELQSPGRTSLRLGDIRAALRLKLWDNERGRLIGLDEFVDAPATAEAEPA